MKPLSPIEAIYKQDFKIKIIFNDGTEGNIQNPNGAI
jgi:hypothetical protein